MNIISSHMLLLILLTLAIDFSEQMKWITESRTIDICKGNDVDLLWKFDEEGDKISKLEWYFNNNIICTSSYAKNFTVNIPYQGRIEKIGKTEIRLKNISQDDEGIFSLLPLLTWSTSQNMQNILLQVLEPPTNKWTCKINYTGHPSKLTCELTTSYCGRPQMSAIWKRKETFEVLGDGNYVLINSSFQDNEIIWCLEGTAIQCLDDPRQLCTFVNIPHGDDEKSSQGGNNTPQMDSVTTLAPHQHDTESTNLHHIQPYVVVVSLTVSALVAIFTLVVLIIVLIQRKNNMDKVEASSMFDTNMKQHAAVKHDPEHETEETITDQQPSTNSEPPRELKEKKDLYKIGLAKKTTQGLKPCYQITCSNCGISLPQYVLPEYQL